MKTALSLMFALVTTMTVTAAAGAGRLVPARLPRIGLVLHATPMAACAWAI
jgi:hypothetical protein